LGKFAAISKKPKICDALSLYQVYKMRRNSLQTHRQTLSFQPIKTHSFQTSKAMNKNLGKTNKSFKQPNTSTSNVCCRISDDFCVIVTKA
jgi:hypothetical protein